MTLDAALHPRDVTVIDGDAGQENSRVSLQSLETFPVQRRQHRTPLRVGRELTVRGTNRAALRRPDGQHQDGVVGSFLMVDERRDIRHTDRVGQEQNRPWHVVTLE